MFMTTTKTKLPPRYVQILDLISKPDGATASQIGSSLGLQNHTVRGMISTARSTYGWKVATRKDRAQKTFYSIRPGDVPGADSAADVKADVAKPTAAKAKAART